MYALSPPNPTENPESLVTLPLDKVSDPEASITVPSAPQDKEAILSEPALISAPKVTFPVNFAKYLVLEPEPDLTPTSQLTFPFATAPRVTIGKLGKGNLKMVTLYSLLPLSLAPVLPNSNEPLPEEMITLFSQEELEIFTEYLKK